MKQKFINDRIDSVEVIRKFRNLSEDAKKNVLKTLLIQDVLGQYEDEKKNDEIDKAAFETANSLLDTLYGEDEELKNRIIQKFIFEYGRVVAVTKKEICGAEHTFSEWEKVMTERPQNSLDGNVEGTCYERFFERTCEYCGSKQRAYSEAQKQAMEEYTENSKIRSLAYKKIMNETNKEN